MGLVRPQPVKLPERSLAVQIGTFAASQCGEVGISAMGCKKIWPLLAACAAREAKKKYPWMYQGI